MGMYPDNASEGAITPITAKISPGGLQGPVGDITGETAGGDLAGTFPNPTLAPFGAGPQTVGDGITVPQVVTDSKGRVLSLTAKPITFPSGSPPTGAAGGDLAGNYPNPSLAPTGIVAGTYGSGTAIPVITLDAKGRAVSASTVSPAFGQRIGVLGALLPADFSSGGDQQIVLNSNRCRITAVIAENPNQNIAGFTQGGITAGPAGTGTRVVSATQGWGGFLTVTNNFFIVPLDTPMATLVITTGFLYLNFGTFQAGPLYKANVWIIGESYA